MLHLKHVFACLSMSENVFECQEKSALVGKRLLTSANVCKTSEMSAFARNVVFYLTRLFKRTKIRLFRFWPCWRFPLLVSPEKICRNFLSVHWPVVRACNWTKCILPFGQKQQQFVAHVASTSGEKFLLEFDLGAGTSSNKWGKAAALCVSDHGVDGQRC